MYLYSTCATRSPRLRSRSSSLSMSSSVTSFPDDAGTPVIPGGNGDTLQIMRFEPGPVDLEEEPTYGPAVSLKEERERERREGRDKSKECSYCYFFRI